MKWYSPIFIIPVAGAIVLLAGWGFYEYRNLVFLRPIPQAVIPIVPTNNSLSVPTYSASPSPFTSAENTVSQLGKEWKKTYSDNQYHFEIQYYQPGWALVSKVGGPDLPYGTLKEPKNLITG